MGTRTTTLRNGTKVTRLGATVPEWRVQAAAVRALRAMPEFGRRFTLAADMAAHKRRPQDATIAKATGLVRGEHDLRLYLEGGRLGLIEYKAENGRLSPEQRDRHALLHRLGFTMQEVVKAATEADAALQTVSVVKGWLAANDHGVTPSCGCVFCDLGLEPVNGKHDVPSEGLAVACPLAGNDDQVKT